MTTTEDRVEETLAELVAPKDLSKPFIYIFLRRDLEKINPMYPAIQLGHATYQLGLGNGADDRDAQYEEPPAFCVFDVADEGALLTVFQTLETQFKDTNISMFEEPDWSTGFTAIAIGPIAGAARQKFAEYKLFRVAKKRFWTLIGQAFLTLRRK